MADIRKVEDFQKILAEADVDTVLALQKVFLEKISGSGGSPAVSCSSCDHHSCHAK